MEIWETQLNDNMGNRKLKTRAEKEKRELKGRSELQGPIPYKTRPPLRRA